MPARKRRKRRPVRPDWTPLQWLSVLLTVSLVVGLSAATIQWRSGYYSGQTLAARVAP
jgi:hypothetical protein